MPKPLDNERWQAMLDAYGHTQTIKHVARTVGVDRTTAKRYIEQGDPAVGRRPIRDLYLEAVAKAQEKAVYTLADAIAENLDATRAIKGFGLNALQEEMRRGHRETITETEHLDALGTRTGRDISRRLEPPSVSMRDIFKAMEIEQRLLGGADQVIELRIEATIGVIVQTLREELHNVLVQMGVPLREIDRAVDNAAQRLELMTRNPTTVD